ncbi:MAG: nucleotidyltransferase domain-containing protein [Candidatus Nanohaloarchaea archaeon]
MKESKYLEIIESLEKVLEDKPVEIGILFGSRAEGEATHLSDIDVAVKFMENVERKQKFRIMDRLTAEITSETGVEKVDLIDLDETRPEIGYRAVRDGKIIMGDEKQRVRLEKNFFKLKEDLKPLRREFRQEMYQRLEGGSYGSA